MTVQADFEKLGGVVTKVAVTVERKVSDGNYGSNGASLVVEANVAKGTDLDALCDALDAYGKAYCKRSLGEAVEQVRQVASTTSAPTPLTNTTAAPTLADSIVAIAAEGTAPQPVTTEEVQHVSIKKFSLMEKPGEKFELLLYPDIKGKAGEWPELKYTADQHDMSNMMRSVWDSTWKAPVEKEVDWVAEFSFGREYIPSKGKNAGKTMRYKDLVNLHTG